MEIFRAAVEICEIAAASSGNKYFLARAIGPLEDRNAPSAFSGFNRAHQSGGSRAQNYGVEFVDFFLVHHDLELRKYNCRTNDYYTLRPPLRRDRPSGESD